MLVNLDAVLPASWSPEFGERVFQFDAFISHNRNDGHSQILAEKLRCQGARVWRDDEQDLSDRAVQSSVSSALIQSRFVIVCIDHGFQDSSWCRAEYLPAIATGKRAGATRILVARVEAEAPIPADLREAAVFNCHRDDELERLAAVITKGNRVPFETSTEVRQQSSELPSHARSIRKRTSRRKDPKSMILRSVASALEAGDTRHPQLLMAARQWLIEQMRPEGFTDEERAFLVAASLFFCTLKDSDDRANGMYILQHLADHDPERSLHDDLAHVFEREPDDSLMQIPIPWFEKQWDSLSAWQRSVAERCAIRDPFQARYHSNSAMVHGFSEVTRVKVFARGLEIGALTCPERIHLLHERVDRLLQNVDAVTGGSIADGVRALMGVTDIEIVFRDLDALLNGHRQHERKEWPNCEAEVVVFVERVVSHSVAHTGFPLLAMEGDLLDWVLKPLLWFSTIPHTRDLASSAYRALCDLIETRGKLALEAPIYRQFLDIALSGADISEGFFSACFNDLQLKLLRAARERDRRKSRSMHAVSSAVA